MGSESISSAIPSILLGWNELSLLISHFHWLTWVNRPLIHDGLCRACADHIRVILLLLLISIATRMTFQSNCRSCVDQSYSTSSRVILLHLLISFTMRMTFQPNFSRWRLQKQMGIELWTSLLLTRSVERKEKCISYVCMLSLSGIKKQSYVSLDISYQAVDELHEW